MNIFRVPVDNQHFKETIENGKPINEIASFLSADEKLKLQTIAKDGVVRYWGSIPGENNKRNFARLTEGDELLCYRSGSYICLAKVLLKIINRELAKYSWGETEVGTTWELIYFLTDVKFFNIKSIIINKEFGFGEGPVMGFGPIAEDKVKEFNNRYGSVANFINNLTPEDKFEKPISEEISKPQIESPFHAQFLLVDIGNQLEFETYVPPIDAGHEVFGKKLDELITVRRDDLIQYVAPAILDPLSHIDVIWFKENYKPKFFYEVIHSSGMTEAFARLKAVSDYYELSKTRIVGSEKIRDDFEKSRRLYFPSSEQISYKLYDELILVYSKTKQYKKIVEEFLR
jgi:hypothetical protein